MTHNTKEGIDPLTDPQAEIEITCPNCQKDFDAGYIVRNEFKIATKFHHQELQKAREEERKKNRIGQIKDVQDQVRKKKEHGKAMYEKGRRDARHDWLREEREETREILRCISRMVEINATNLENYILGQMPIVQSEQTQRLQLTSQLKQQVNFTEDSATRFLREYQKHSFYARGKTIPE